MTLVEYQLTLRQMHLTDSRWHSNYQHYNIRCSFLTNPSSCESYHSHHNHRKPMCVHALVMHLYKQHIARACDGLIHFSTTNPMRLGNNHCVEILSLPMNRSRSIVHRQFEHISCHHK